MRVDLSLAKSSTKFLQLLALFGGLTMVLGCAGPATPFGASNYSFSSEEPSGRSGRLQNMFHWWVSPDVSIETFPKDQIFHRLANLEFRISDKGGIDPKSQVHVRYDGRDVTQNFSFLPSNSRQEMRLVFNNLRLNPAKLHTIEVSYQRNPEARPFTKKLVTPICDPTKMDPVEKTLGFTVDEKLLKEINTAAVDDAKINPILLAALIANESGFNSKAVSVQKAIGLTQITHIAEDEILEKINQWPRYPGIRDMSFVELKYKIMTEDITAKDEWRLQDDLSLRGGAFYLAHVGEYWRLDRKKDLLKASGASYSQVLLASYNIGPAAVSRAIERKGAEWLRDSEGAKALKYVQMVGSYCQEFSGGSKNEN